MIYGGGKNGLMGEVARSSKNNGGYVEGIIPKFLRSKENINKNLDKIIITKNMSERKKLLYEKGDAFLALPGGPGTIEEITEIISWLNLGLHKKPIIIFNYNKFWTPLINMYKKTYLKKFNHIKIESLFYCVNSVGQLKKLL